MAQFNKTLKELRKSKGLTQVELGKRLGVSSQVISNWERGYTTGISADTLALLSEIFNVSSDDLLGTVELKKQDMPYSSNTNRFVYSRLQSLLSEDPGIEFFSTVSRIPVDVLQQYISGKLSPNAYDLCKLVEVLDTSADYLFGKSDIPHPDDSNTFYPRDGFPVQLRDEMDGNYLETELAEKLDLTISDIKKLLSGESTPDPSLLYDMAQIFKKSTDYLLGIAEHPRRQDIDGNYPFVFDKHIAERISKLMDAYGNNSFWTDFLSITEDEVVLLKEYGFVVHFSVLTRLADMLQVSIDYLAGRTNAKKTLSAENQEEDLVLAYRYLDEENKPIAYGEVMKLKKEQERDYYLRSANSVAAEGANHKTGTDNLGK